MTKESNKITLAIKKAWREKRLVKLRCRKCAYKEESIATCHICEDEEDADTAEGSGTCRDATTARQGVAAERDADTAADTAEGRGTCRDATTARQEVAAEEDADTAEGSGTMQRCNHGQTGSDC